MTKPFIAENAGRYVAVVNPADITVPLAINADGSINVKLEATPTIDIGKVELLGDDGNVLAGTGADAAWNGAASPTTWTAIFKYTVARLSSILTALGTPFQAGGSIANTAFGISGTLPAFAATPGVNLDSVADGVTQTSGNVTSATTLLSWADTSGYGYIAFGFTSVGTGATIVIDEAADGATFNAAGTFWRIDSPALSAPIASQASPTTAMQFVVPVTAKGMRIRASVYGSGNVNCYATLKRGACPGPYNLNSISSALGVYGMGNASANNLSTHKLIATASTNATSVKTSQGRIANGVISNQSASWRWIKFYNKASGPTVGTDTPGWTIGLPPGQNTPVEPFVGAMGDFFATGIAYAITGLPADSDTTAISAGDVIVNLGYA